MVSMRAIFVSLVVLVACGTKINPDVCCTDAADCTAKGVPAGSMCTDGLVCRGNSCIAETCTTSNQCEPVAPFCSSAMLCAATCAMDSECPGFGSSGLPFCESGACVACRVNSDCTDANHAFCEGGACRGCLEDSECGSGLCEPSGGCANPAEVLYVSPTGADTGNCELSAPCASLGYAVTRATAARSTVSMSDGTYNQAPFVVHANSTSATSLDIHGHNSILNGSYGDNYLFQFELDLTMRDLTIHTANSGAGLNLTSQGASSKLMNLTIDGGAGSAIFLKGQVTASKLTIHDCYQGIADGGLLTIDTSSIYNNTTGAIVVGLFDGQAYQQATLQASNLLIYGSSERSSISVANGIGTVSSSTIANSFSGTTAYPAGVDCAMSAGIKFRSTIVWGPSNRPVAPGCNIDNTSIVGPTGITGVMNIDPLFANAASGNYHLTSGSPAIDKVDTGPEHDFEGDARPQGVKFDIGADEYKP
jgi:hypothetical protein